MERHFRKKANWLFAQIALAGIILLSLIAGLTHKIYNFVMSTVGEFTASQAHAICGCATLSSPKHSALAGLAAIVGAALIASVLIALARVVFTWQKTKRFIQKQNLHIVNKSRKLAEVCAALGLENKVKEINTDKPIIFCHGLKSPQIYVSSAIVAGLNFSELSAVLLHETGHLLAKEPARMLLIKFIKTFRFMPGLNGLAKKYSALAELAADELATKNFTEKNNLARAMRKILEMEEKNIIQKELALSYFSAITEERVLALSEINYRPAIKPEAIKAIFGLMLAIVFVLFFGSEIKAQENHAKEFYAASPCAQQIQAMTNCANGWTKCADKIYHEEKTECAKPNWLWRAVDNLN